MKDIILFYLTILLLLCSCKVEERSRFIAYRYPSKTILGVVGVSDYSKEFVTMLVHDTVSNCATYLIAPLHNRDATMLIIRSDSGSYITQDYLNFDISYNIYWLDLMDGELYDCRGAYYDSYYYLGKEGNSLYRISYEKILLLDSTSKAVWHGGDTKPIPEESSCLGFLYNQKMYPKRFPDPLIKIDKINYRELSYPLAGKANEKRLRPALEALFSGRPILEVDSLLKVGFEGINRDTFKMDAP